MRECLRIYINIYYCYVYSKMMKNSFKFFDFCIIRLALFEICKIHYVYSYCAAQIRYAYKFITEMRQKILIL